MCAVKNPSKRSNQSWFYNIFLGKLYENKPDRNHTKVNWIMNLTENEIVLLKEKTCKIIEISNNTYIKTDNTKSRKNEFKEGCETLFNLFNNIMKDKDIKKKIRGFLTTSEGKPSKDYKKIIKIERILKEE